MKRAVLVVALGLAFGCADGDDRVDGDTVSMEMPLDGETGALDEEVPPEYEVPDVPPGDFWQADGSSWEVQRTLDCPGGGTVQVSAELVERQDPVLTQFDADWDYGDCVTMTHGTINGRVSYSKDVAEKDAGWFMGVRYFAKVLYSDSVVGKCDAYSVMSKTMPQVSTRTKLQSFCTHPVSQWWTELGLDCCGQM